MKIFDERKNQEITIKFTGKAGALLLKLKINPEEVLIVKNDELVTIDENLQDSDNIQLLSVISGG